MKKFLISTLLLVVLILSVTSCSSNNPSPNNEEAPFGLNEVATFEDLKFTATEITENLGTQLFAPDEGNVFVGIKFTIENISSKEQSVSSMLLFEPYCDDVKVDYSLSASAAFEGSLDGSIAAGKKLVGYYSIEVPALWNTIELEVKPNWLSNKSATFVFNRDLVNNQPPETNNPLTSSPEESTVVETTAPSKNLSLNESAVFKKLKFTATEIVENTGSQLFKPAEGKIFIGIKLTIENISTQEQSISSLMLFNAYCEDIKLDYSFSANSAFEGTLDGEVAAGKKLVGYYGIEVPSNWKTIELEVKEDWLSNDSASFVFSK